MGRPKGFPELARLRLEKQVPPIALGTGWRTSLGLAGAQANKRLLLSPKG